MNAGSKVLLWCGLWVWLLLCCCAAPVEAQTLSVPQLLKQQDRWGELADAGARVQLEGRFQSRTAESFRLEKLELIFRHPPTVRLPDRIRRAQRVEVTGGLTRDGSRLFFTVQRLQVGETDEEQLRRRMGEPGNEQPEKLLLLAAEYVPRAEFYEDDVLRQEIQAVRGQAIQRQKQLVRNDPLGLAGLLQSAEQLGVSAETTGQLRFELLALRLKQPGTELQSLLADARRMEGWDDRQQVIPASLQQAFAKNAGAAWTAATPAERRLLQRLLYVQLRLLDLRQQLKTDGSNGLELGRLVREELPTEVQVAQELEQREVQWQLSRAAELDREELIAVSGLLLRLDRVAENTQLRTAWLQGQEQRFGLQTLAGQIRTADEYLFVGEEWQNRAARERGVELLKQAWERAVQESPADADGLAQRLKTLGWERLKNSWISSADFLKRPPDDVQRAAREGRVVKGMTAEQVSQTLGRPNRTAKLVAQRVFREFWIYEEAGLVVRLRRNLQRANEVLVVEDVVRDEAARRKQD